MSNFLRRSAQGAGVPHEKGTSNLETVAMPLPSKIVLSMGQHIGAPAAPAVAKGDQVYVGTVVGKAGGFVSADIHSGVSGTVTEITTITAPNGAAQQAVVITPDGQQTVDPSIAPPQVTDMKSFVDAVRASGLVGLGGAGFPTAVKLSPKNLDEIDMLVINGAECEPYITSDNRCFIEDTHHVLNGIKQVMKYLNIAKCVIGIEGNKPEAIAKMKDGVILVNTSRGDLIRTQDLIDGLLAKKFGGVGLDVYDEEGGVFYEDCSNDIMEDSNLARLTTFPNVLVTSHMGFFTREAVEAIADVTLRNADAVRKQEKLDNAV